MMRKLIVLGVVYLILCDVIATNASCVTNNTSYSNVSLIHEACVKSRNLRDRRSRYPTAEPLYCPPCEQIHCYKQRNRRLRCKGGYALGICGCCRVCAKLDGEQCGGQHNYLGSCDEGLVCDPQAPALISYITNGIKRVYKVEKGICRKGFITPTIPVEICKPKCSPEYCMTNPRAICSASENTEEINQCQGLCQHTSCRACRFVNLGEICSSCAKDDFRCIREFGRCVRKQKCKPKDYPCAKSTTKRKATDNFLCQVPKCLVSK